MSDDKQMSVEHWANRPEPDSLGRVEPWGAEPKEVEFSEKWISTQDRLPKVRVESIVLINWGFNEPVDDIVISVGCIDDGTWVALWHEPSEPFQVICAGCVTHWQPLPLPPTLKEPTHERL